MGPLANAANTMDPSVLAAVVAGVAALVGAVSGAMAGVVLGWMTNRASWKRQNRELAIRTAIEDWRARNEWAQMMAKAGHGVPLPRLGDWIVQYCKLFDEVLEKGVTPEAERRFSELFEPPEGTKKKGA